MAHLELSGIDFVLPDGRPLLHDVHFRVGNGQRVALIGPNGTGKTTLIRIVTGELTPHDGAVTTSGTVAVMSQFIGKLRNEQRSSQAGVNSMSRPWAGDATVRDLLISVAPERIRLAASAVDAAELAVMQTDDEAAQMAYAQALADWGDADGYEFELAVWDVVTTKAFGMPFERAQWRSVASLSGGEQKRLVLEALLESPADLLVLDEPDNYLDVPTKRWLEEQLIESGRTVLFISHDRELLSRVATSVVTLEPGRAGATAWTHPGSFATWREARIARNARLEELLRRWDQEHAKLKAQVIMYRQKAAYNADMASRLQAAVTKLEKFEQAGPPEKVAITQNVRMHRQTRSDL